MASPPFPPPGSLQFKLVKTFVSLSVRVYRLTGGRLGGKVTGAPVLLLDHLGRKTRRARTTPVLYLRDGADLVIVGSRGGSDAMPAWFLNLMSSPSTTVQVGSERRAVVARQATPEEKQRLLATAGRDVRRIRGLPAAHQARDPGRDPEPGQLGHRLLRFVTG